VREAREGVSPEGHRRSLRRGHLAAHRLAKFVNAFLRSPTLLAEYQGKLAQHRAICSSASKFAREIEKLAPAVDRATSPENAEYPWLRGKTVLTPCEYLYPALSLLSGPTGTAFLRLVERAFRDYAQIAIH
jgi:hypothetical protein